MRHWSFVFIAYLVNSQEVGEAGGQQYGVPTGTYTAQGSAVENQGPWTNAAPSSVTYDYNDSGQPLSTSTNAIAALPQQTSSTYTLASNATQNLPLNTDSSYYGVPTSASTASENNDVVQTDPLQASQMTSNLSSTTSQFQFVHTPMGNDFPSPTGFSTSAPSSDYNYMQSPLLNASQNIPATNSEYPYPIATHLAHPVDILTSLTEDGADRTSTRKPKKPKKKHHIPDPPPTDYFIVEPPPPIIIHDLAPGWDTNVSAIQLLEDIQARLERVEQANAPRYTGILPVQYFDERQPVPQKVEIQSNAPSYRPVQITDEELLAREAIKLSPYRQMPKEVTIYCYPFTPEEITQKCLGAMETLGATGVYLPMMAEIGTEKPPEYYDAVRTLRRMRRKDGKKYQIYGVSYDNPNWALLTQIVLNHDLWDGILLEWVGGNACIWNINQPTRGQIDTLLANAGPIYYFFRQQTCDQSLVMSSPYGAAFVNPNDEVDVSDISVVKGEFPKFLIPVFPCFQGEEGPCYNAFRYYTEDACSEKQKFAFSPYEALGGLMMHLANETCRGMPEHDLYSVV